MSHVFGRPTNEAWRGEESRREERGEEREQVAGFSPRHESGRLYFASADIYSTPHSFATDVRCDGALGGRRGQSAGFEEGGGRE